MREKGKCLELENLLVYIYICYQRENRRGQSVGSARSAYKSATKKKVYRALEYRIGRIE